MADNIQKEGMLQVGTKLSNGKYRIDQYLSSGGFGNTYVATDTAFNEKVAVKELFIKGVCGRTPNSTDISISLTENQRAFSAQQEKFRKEARRLRKLSNPHIVKVHDLFDENGTSYYVMDFVEGESLSARLKRTKKPMQEGELLLMLPQVLDALECVHNEGIWHLDLKPGNIMIDHKGNVQLIDFGASKQLKNANGDSLSTSSAMAYTPGYAPSEQMEQNFEKFGPWTDLYALGATLYNLLTMQQPPSPSDIEEDSRAALKLPQGISRKTEKLVFWLMKPNRKMRPQCVADIRQFLVEAGEIPSSGGRKQDDDDPTIIKDGPIPKPSVSKPSVPKPGPIPPVKKIAIGAAVLACLCVIIFSVKKCSSDSIPEEVVDSTQVHYRVVSVSEGPTNMHRYSYSGTWIDGSPNGKGTAKFAKYGDIPAATYEGIFEDGLCTDLTGEATMTFETGDKYVGTFENGYYVKGRYILPDNSYFEGTFRNGTPYNGKWYSANGSFDGEVVNGKEK